MVTLETKDNQALILMLEQQDAMADTASRRSVLRLAGLQALIPQIDLSGASFVAASSIVRFLAS